MLIYICNIWRTFKIEEKKDKAIKNEVKNTLWKKEMQMTQALSKMPTILRMRKKPY